MILLKDGSLQPVLAQFGAAPAVTLLTEPVHTDTDALFKE